MDIQIKQAKNSSNGLNAPKKKPLWDTLQSNCQKTMTKRILKTAIEKHHVTYKETSIRITADLSAETSQARRKWNDIF